MNYSFESQKGLIRVGAIVGLNTNTFASKTLTFNIFETEKTEVTFGKFIVVDRSKAQVSLGRAPFEGQTLIDIVGESTSSSIKSHVGIGTLTIDIFSRNYDFKWRSRGGLIRLNDDKKLTITQGFRAPYKASGLFNVSGIAGQSYTRRPYIGTGSLSVYGNGLTRKISVYGYYGDGGEFKTSGTLILAQQTLLTKENKTKSYSGSGQLFSQVTSTSRKSFGYVGKGSISVSGTSEQSISVSSKSATQLFEFSSFAISSSRTGIQIVGDVATYDLYGDSSSRRTFSESSFGEIKLTGESTSRITKSKSSVSGLFRFTRHDVDNTYDTCDSENITCDDQNSAAFRFSYNTPQRVVLFNLEGNSNTQIRSLYLYNGSTTYQVSGSYSGFKFSSSNVGFGTLFTSGSYSQSNTKSYSGFGDSLTIFGSSYSSLTKSPIPSTALYNLFGSGLTRTELEYDFDTDGTINFNGSANIKSVYSESGFVDFNLQGELNYPDVRFIPASKTGGFINISGYSNDSIVKLYAETVGTLFTISFGLESFSRPSYVGIGSMHIQEISNPTTINKYQIPRTYVSII